MNDVPDVSRNPYEPPTLNAHTDQSLVGPPYLYPIVAVCAISTAIPILQTLALLANFFVSRPIGNVGARILIGAYALFPIVTITVGSATGGHRFSRLVTTTIAIAVIELITFTAVGLLYALTTFQND